MMADAYVPTSPDHVQQILHGNQDTTERRPPTASFSRLSQGDFRLHEEVKQLPGEIDRLFDTLKEPNYVKQVVEESMRLYPPGMGD